MDPGRPIAIEVLSFFYYTFTTMNIYTRAVSARLREANSKVVGLLLPTGA